ncbi:glycosyltransferase family A protein [Elizabethkingia sp. HX XZB]|uniref:glycosyltransferase family 2 protein n=1 Tax=Elizabethkingia sp. HX XZB TaxID=3003193 RepID=UPI002A23E633|nr:glycosyltransferase family A protein [Elizabethkingia sp. HX XZB]MDX8568438.1 glycosyltransferase family A protein [Elizabethkingia sp. HX XZB]
MENKLVSIIVPCYNHAVFLSECIESLLQQSYQKWECIIVDDGSTDETKIVAQLFSNRDKRIHYLYKENGGLSSARNFGIKNSLGEFILPLDADDKITPVYIEKAIEVFAKNSDIALIYGRANFFGDIEKEWDLPKYDYPNLLYGNQIYCSSIYKKELYELSNGYDEDMKDGFEDWDFLIRALDYRIIYKLEDVVFFYRIKNNSMMQSLNANKLKHIQVKKYIYNKNIKKYKKYWPILRHVYYLKYELLTILFTIKKWIQINK